MGLNIGAAGVSSVTLGGAPLATIHVGTTKVWPDIAIWRGAVKCSVGRVQVNFINENGSGFPLSIVNGTVIRMMYSDSPDFASPSVNDQPNVWSKDAKQIITAIDGWYNFPFAGVRDGYVTIYYR